MTKKYLNRAAAVLLSTILAVMPLGINTAAADTSDIMSVGTNTGAAVCPGGIPFGVKFYTDGVIVSSLEEVPTEDGITSPALNAGLKIKDIIIEINGRHVTGAAAVSAAIASCGGKPLVLTVKRGSETLELTLIPAKSTGDGKYKAGMWLKDSTAGVGTITYINPETGEFAGLGHGICDGDTGELLPLMRGVVMDVTVNGIKRGIPGSPGELRGSFGAAKIGTLIGNSNTGVYGVLSNMPKEFETVEIGGRNEIHEGTATIISTLDGNGRCEYTVELSAIERSGTGSKNFIVTVTDKALLEKTGGIVQGMSGSPILQDGKLVGAVTHVFVNDPTKGYGIFAENMLETAKQVAEEQAKKDAS